MSREVAKRRPTIREVARLAGVSHQTVSRYLRDDPTVNEAMQQRIGQAIAQLDYRPNLVARAMRDRRTGRLALLLPSGTAGSALEMLTGAAAEAHEAGYVVEVVTLGGPTESRAGRVLELADSGLFEGILAATPLPGLSERSMSGATPIVISADYDDQMRSIGELADASTTAEIIERLARQGHRRFLHIAGDYAHTSARRRRQVYLETIERLALESYGVADCAWLAESARRAVLDLPADCGVTAVVCANDVLAAGAIRGAVERGWRVPHDLSVTGWDDNALGAAMMPSLTTVSVDHERLGRRAIRRLLAVLRGQPEPEEHERITSVVWRESTAPAPQD
ncbi:LacI family DNA-binding transcriptional regulator [Allostreptomyces psammosilenae]|uniref:DNA-binding LacI/PurR family transcriptional regulator n=1 Tax=Allostreptomyces psammosilenae TaxID=1892865 RepID=A0A853A9Z2_9ACTN|nr:LacI family DNA-binding transcriptional regulator [Allostreptomyces psammosilenae]NYI07441.1 DNA-binding LacI/PurR family transcriptional regulator [Allostreptomyces psammosilenae]